MGESIQRGFERIALATRCQHEAIDAFTLNGQSADLPSAG